MGIRDTIKGAAHVVAAERDADKARAAHDRGDYNEADRHTQNSTRHADKAVEHFDK